MARISLQWFYIEGVLSPIQRRFACDRVTRHNLQGAKEGIKWTVWLEYPLYCGSNREQKMLQGNWFV